MLKTSILLLFLIPQAVYASVGLSCLSGEEVRLDAPGGTLANFKVEDQDGLGTCHVNALSVMLSSALAGNPQVSYLDLAMSDRTGDGKAVRYLDEGTAATYIDAGDSCASFNAAKKTGVCAESDFFLEDLYQNKGQGSDVQTKVVSALAKYFDAYKAMSAQESSDYLDKLKRLFSTAHAQVDQVCGKPEDYTMLDLVQRFANEIVTSVETDREQVQDLIQFIAQKEKQDEQASVQIQKAGDAIDHGIAVERKNSVHKSLLRMIDEKTRISAIIKAEDSFLQLIGTLKPEASKNAAVLGTYLFILDAKIQARVKKSFPEKVTHDSYDEKGLEQILSTMLAQELAQSGLKVKNHNATITRLLAGLPTEPQRNCKINMIRAKFANDQTFLNSLAPECPACVTAAQLKIIRPAVELMGLEEAEYPYTKKIPALFNTYQTRDQYFNATIAGQCRSHKTAIPSSLSCKDYALPLKKTSTFEETALFSRDKIIASLAKGRAVGISFCTSVLKDPFVDTKFTEDHCVRHYGDGSHAVSIIGYRCQAGTIEYLVQNSWGQASKASYSPTYEVNVDRGSFWIPESSLIKNMRTFRLIEGTN